MIEPDALFAGLCRLAIVDTPRAVRLTLGQGSLELTRNDTSGRWWTTTAVPVDSASSRTRSIVVSFASLRSAIELVRGAVVCQLTVRSPLAVEIGDTVIGAQPNEAVPLPHGFVEWQLADALLPVPRHDDHGHETTFKFARGVATVANASLRRMQQRGVAVARAFVVDDRAFLVGAVDDDARVMMFAEARVVEAPAG